jgi:NADP-reducing hydrogenase subunit HndB
MKKLKTGDLKKIRDKVRRTADLRQRQSRARIIVHMGTCGIAAGAEEIRAALTREMEKRKMHDVLLGTSGCAGLCCREPMITVELTGEAPVKYVDLTAEKIAAICQEHLVKGTIVKKYALAVGSERTH